MKSPRDAQETIHQAVDIGFSLADLIGGLFSNIETKTVLWKSKKRGVANDNDEDSVVLGWDSDANQPYVEYTKYNSSGATLCLSSCDGTGLGVNVAGIQLSDSGITPLPDLTQFVNGIFTVTVQDDPNQDAVTLRGAVFATPGSFPLSASPFTVEFTATQTNEDASVTMTIPNGLPYSYIFNVNGVVQGSAQAVSAAAALEPNQTSLKIDLGQPLYPGTVFQVLTISVALQVL